jgi:alkylresorcinol/alkylpyrone synthase
VSASVRGQGHAVPGRMDQAGLWRDFFAAHYAEVPIAERIWQASGVTTRHGVVDPRVEDVSAWGTEARMRRFVAEAMPLGKDAVAAALDDAGVAASDVGFFAVASCTGYATPGVDIMLARDLGFPVSVQRLHIGHMGCYAAVPALAAVSDAVVSRGLTAAMLCVELTSLHVQPPTDDLQQVVAHALFADAASAVVLTPGGPGLEVVDFIAATDVEHAPAMTWDVTDLGFRMGLSPTVPDVLARHVRAAVLDLLGRHDVAVSDVAAWAIHPGGPRIVDVCQEQLGLSDASVAASREVLAGYGNCSSATVLLVLDRLRPTVPSGAPVVMLAFGPGLTLYGALLRAT